MISAAVKTDFADMDLAKIAEFVRNCEDMHILRQINQQILMPQINKIYAVKGKAFTDHAIGNGDLMIAESEGKLHVYMVNEVELSNRLVKAWYYYDRENGYENAKFNISDVYDVIPVNKIEATSREEFREKVMVMVYEHIEACIQDVAQIPDVEYLLDDLCDVWEW